MTILVVWPGIIALNPAQTDMDPLTSVLDKAAAYCERLKTAVFSYACEERIDETAYSPFKGWKLVGKFPEPIRDGIALRSSKPKLRSWLFLYKMEKENKGIQEHRYTLSGNGRVSEKPQDLPDLDLFDFRFVTLGPIGLFSRFNQAHFNYRLVKKEMRFDRTCLVVEAIPCPGTPLCLYGTAWIDESDGAVIRIAWAPESLGNYQNIETKAAKFAVTPEIELASEYCEEKNGILFPSRFSLIEKYSTPEYPYLLSSILFVEYSQYRFFHIDVQERRKKMYTPALNEK